MSFRDDVDALYHRATLLQSEVDRMQAQLAERDRELASLRGQDFSREDTSPGIRQTRNLPDPDEVLARINMVRIPEPENYPDPPARNETADALRTLDLLRPPEIFQSRNALLAVMRSSLALLDDDTLRRMSPLIESLAQLSVTERGYVLEQLGR